MSHDGGVSVSINRGKSWIQTQLPLAQMYHVTVDNQIPYNVYGNRQDGPSAMVPSNSRTGDPGIPDFPTIFRGHSVTVGGGESGWATPDTVDGNLVWSSGSGSGTIGGIVTRYDRRTKLTQNVEVWPMSTVGWPADSLKYRFVWTMPLTLSSHDHNVVYVGSQYVHVTSDGGNHWKEISPDLTQERQVAAEDLRRPDAGQHWRRVRGRRVRDRRVAAGREGAVGGHERWARARHARWRRRTGRTSRRTSRAVLEWGTISNIEPSRYDAGTAYLTVDGHQVNNRDPWVYKTTDFGKTWRLITTGLAKTPLSYAHVVKEDPVRRGLLYLGTEGGLYVSFNDGGSWQPLQNNLPHAPVYWIVVQPHFSDLVVATYGRGFWILDDITPLRTLGSAVTSKDSASLPAARRVSPAYDGAAVRGELRCVRRFQSAGWRADQLLSQEGQ